jgi:hypothetical protein
VISVVWHETEDDQITAWLAATDAAFEHRSPFR